MKWNNIVFLYITINLTKIIRLYNITSKNIQEICNIYLQWRNYRVAQLAKYHEPPAQWGPEPQRPQAQKWTYIFNKI